MATTYEKIATTTLSSTATDITFSSIPATYTDLKIVWVGKRTAGGQNLRIRFNSDTGSNYSATWISGDGTDALSNRTTSATQGTGPRIISDQFSMGLIDIFSYTASVNKTFLVTSAADYNGGGEVYNIVNLWRSTSTISTIELSISASSMTIGTTATLYGILRA